MTLSSHFQAEVRQKLRQLDEFLSSQSHLCIDVILNFDQCCLTVVLAMPNLSLRSLTSNYGDTEEDITLSKVCKTCTPHVHVMYVRRTKIDKMNGRKNICNFDQRGKFTPRFKTQTFPSIFLRDQFLRNLSWKFVSLHYHVTQKALFFHIFQCQRGKKRICAKRQTGWTKLYLCSEFRSNGHWGPQENGQGQAEK